MASKTVHFSWDILHKLTFSARLNFACFSNVFLKNIDFAWDIPSTLRFRTRVISFLTFTKKHMKIQLLRRRQPQNALLNFLKKSKLSLLPTCEIALSCRRDTDLSAATVLQTNAILFLRFSLNCVAPARDAHSSCRKLSKWLQNGNKLVPHKTIRV